MKENENISFLELNSQKTIDPNTLFDDSLAWDDKFDPNLNKPATRFNIDLNNVSRVSEKDLDRKLMEDLESEEVNYNFD